MKVKSSQKARLAAILTFTLMSSQGVMASGTTASAITPQPGVYGYYVDVYKNNTSDNKTPETNPSIGVLSEYLKLWTPGSEWNNGTKVNAQVLDANIAKSIEITKARTKEEGIDAYLFDRRNQNTSAILGLGPYVKAFMAGTNAGTTIPDEIPAAAKKVKYDDEGNSNGAWADEDSKYGSMVKLVNTIRNGSASTSSAKAYFKYPRPFRWSSQINMLPELVPAKKDDPSNDGGFPSGHTNAAYLASYGLAYAMPERFDEILTNASEIGNSRIAAGMHSCLDIVGGRIMSTAVTAAVLNDPENAQVKAEAYEAARALLQDSKTADNRYGDYAANKQKYIERLTYGFEQIGDKTKPMVVPKGAEVLLETRLPYLDAEQRRYVLLTTGLPSGYPVLDDAEGWGRLNLFAASNGYGSFETDVIVKMDASKGGFNAFDTWRNDISGKGKLVKEGTGTLALSGNNKYIGGTLLQEGSLQAESSNAFGKGDVKNNGGTLAETVTGTVNIQGDLMQLQEGEIILNIASDKDVLNISGKASLSGTLKVNFTEGYVPSEDLVLMTYDEGDQSKFTALEVNGLPEGTKTELAYEAHELHLVIANK